MSAPTLMALARRLGAACLESGAMVSVAESCTGGGLAAAITSIAGSSAWFDRGFVTYSNEAKREMLGVPRAVLEQVKSGKPEIYYRVVARVAQRISDRLRAASDMLAGLAESAPQISSYRVEHDSLGEREIPNNAYYGVQTVRALENFAISGVPLRNFAHFVNALAYVKKAADAGKCYDTAIKEVKLPKYESWGNYAAWLPGNVERYCYLYRSGF